MQIMFFGMGKEIGSVRTDCTGTECRTRLNFEGGGEKASGPSEFDYGSLLDWKTRWQSVAIDGKEKVNGEDAYVVTKVTNDGQREIDYVSATSYLPLKREPEILVNGVLMRAGSETFADYRNVGGILVPMRLQGSMLTLGQFSAVVREVNRG